MLESKLRFFIDQAAGHHEVTGNPFRALGFQRLNLVLGGTVKFLARDILVDFRGTFPVGAVGAAKVSGIGDTGRTVLGAVTTELTRTGVAAVKTAGCTVLAVAERLAVVAAGEPATLAFTFTARTITVRLVAAVTVGLAFSPAAAEAATVTFTVTARTVTNGLTITVATAEATTITLTLTARTVTKRLTITVATAEATTITLTLTTGTVTKRLTITVATAEATTITLTLTTGTITKRLTITVATAEATTITLTLTTGTITKGLTVAIPERLALPEGLAVAGVRPTLWTLGIAVIAGPESAWIATGVVRSAEGAAIVPAAIAAVVLSHGDSSCCEPTTGAIAAARSVFRYPTQPEIKRFEVRTSQSILSETPPDHDMDPHAKPGRGNVHTSLKRSRGCCGFRGDALAVRVGV
ncbi:hypothetical protein, partial [Pseudarthrobacter sulfonivorans]|uniref:hypothetical protein n=1 Tax=Pseudarthrobacter sulfonivorans TaxID=121292 RepID=UPI0021053B67